MPCPSHPPWLDHSNYTWRRVQVIGSLHKLRNNQCVDLRVYNSIHLTTQHSCDKGKE
jgi:hypothetical protein